MVATKELGPYELSWLCLTRSAPSATLAEIGDGGSCMRRRIVLAALGAAMVGASPAVSFAQPRKRIGILMAVAETDRDVRAGLQIFSEELRNLGWIEGQNLQIKYRW